MPVQCMERLGPIPPVRPFRQFDWERRRKLLALAKMLVESTVYESTQRTVDWLISLCEDRDPEPVQNLDWLEQRMNDDFDALSNLDIGSRSMTKLVPQMRFTARMLRVRERYKIIETVQFTPCKACFPPSDIACARHFEGFYAVIGVSQSCLNLKHRNK